MQKILTTQKQMTSKKAALKFALEKKLCEMSFYEFFKAAWHIVEPAVP